MSISIIGKVTTAPTHAHRVLFPHDATEEQIVYEVNGVPCIETSLDTHGNAGLTPFFLLCERNGELTATKNGYRAKTTEIPQISTEEAERLPEVLRFTVNPDCLEYWGTDVTEETILSFGEVLRLAREWGKTVLELLDQLTEVE